MTRIRLGVLVLVSLLAHPAEPSAGELDFSGHVTGELRIFPAAPAFAVQEDRPLSPSVATELEWVYDAGPDGRFTFVPFFRLDADDGERTHADIREAAYLRSGQGWSVLAGVSRVFWGVTESRHLVDIVNQIDAVEDPLEGEDKLGQPMVNLNLLRNRGALGIYVLPGFRERTFPDEGARFSGGLPVKTGAAVFEADAGRGAVDFAVRWKQVIGPWDIGVSHFHGTSREPRLVPTLEADGTAALVPFYDRIDQTGLDLQYTGEAWLWKLEAITRAGHDDRFAAAVGGFEYTLYSALGTKADIGLLGEYLWDNRGSGAPDTIFDNDVFVGVRLTLNDIEGTSLLAGAVVDNEDGTTVGLIEAERRLADDWKLEVKARLLFGVGKTDILGPIRRDSTISIQLTRFF